MKFIVDTLVAFCVKNSLIDPEMKDWLRYGFEKRLSTFIVLIPFFILAVLLSAPSTALSFFVSFFSLKRCTNGFHANTIWGCLFASLLFEYLFLGVICPILNSHNAVWINIVCGIIVILLAPYNHPNIHLSKEESYILRRISRRTILLLILAVAICFLAEAVGIAKGLTAGIAMAAFLLCLAYISEWRNQNERNY